MRRPPARPCDCLVAVGTFLRLGWAEGDKLNVQMSDEIVTFGGARLIATKVVGVAVGLVVAIFSMSNGSSFGYVFGAVLVALVAFEALIIPYEASVGPDNLLVFRSVARKRTVYVEDVTRVERRAGEGGVAWKFIYVDGSSRLAGSAGQRLGEYLCRLNPAIRLDLEGGCKPDKKLFADSTGFDPKAMTEPDWVNQGEKVSAQDLVRRQREAQQNSREQRGSEGNTRPSSPT